MSGKKSHSIFSKISEGGEICWMAVAWSGRLQKEKAAIDVDSKCQLPSQFWPDEPWHPWDGKSRIYFNNINRMNDNFSGCNRGVEDVKFKTMARLFQANSETIITLWNSKCTAQ